MSHTYAPGNKYKYETYGEGGSDDTWIYPIPNYYSILLNINHPPPLEGGKGNSFLKWVALCFMFGILSSGLSI